MSVQQLCESVPEVQESTSRPQCQCDPWYIPCRNTASWIVTRHDCPARAFGRWRAELMLKLVGNDRIIHSGARSGYMCSECRDNLQIKFSFGPVHCWGCLRKFHAYSEYYPVEVKL